MKEFVLSVFCCMLLLTDCSSKVQEKGKMQQVGIEDAFSKMDRKGAFLPMITKDRYHYCQLIHKMLDGMIEDHPTTIYNIKMDDSTAESLYTDNDLLKTGLEKSGIIPRIYYIKDGVAKDDVTGSSKENPLEFQEWIKKYNIENLKQKQEDGKTFISCFKISLHPGTKGDRFHRLKIMRLIPFCLGHHDFAYFQIGIRQGVSPYVMYPAQIL